MDKGVQMGIRKDRHLVMRMEDTVFGETVERRQQSSFAYCYFNRGIIAAASTHNVELSTFDMCVLECTYIWVLWVSQSVSRWTGTDIWPLCAAEALSSITVSWSYVQGTPCNVKLVTG